MQVITTQSPQGARFTLYKETTAIGTALLCGNCLAELVVDPAWRRRGYGSYLLKELLRQNGGFDPHSASLFTALLPADPGACAFAARFGFVVQGEILVRRRVPDLTAVELTHRFLAGALAPGGLYLDATCGNGHDTLFLCGLAGAGGRVIGLDIQPQAVQNTNERLAAQGQAAVGQAFCADHSELLRFAAPGTADCVLFNFGWLPGAAHSVHSRAQSTLAALQAAAAALKPGGVLAAVLYSGKVIGHEEKDAALAWFETLPLTQYTVLVCRFANWADTAPLPCFALKKPFGPP